MNYRTWRIFILHIIAVACFMLITPLFAIAASEKPECSLTVTSTNGTTTINKKKGEEVYFMKGSTVTIHWKSENAEDVFDSQGELLPERGSSTTSPLQSETITFTAKDGGTKSTCSLRLIPVTATFAPSSLSVATSSKPTLKGTVTGTERVHVVIKKSGTKKVVHTSRLVKAKKDAWSIRVKKLPVGAYTVELRGPKDVSGNLIAASTLTIGEPKEVAEGGTLTIKPISLLTGGVVRRGESVPVSYLQVINSSKKNVILKGFWVAQRRSLSTKAIRGLSTADDTGLLRGAAEGSDELFVDGKAFAPTPDVLITPGSMRLFTIKAALISSLSPHLGKQLKLEVASVVGNGTAVGNFPIRGTTWTIAP